MSYEELYNLTFQKRTQMKLIFKSMVSLIVLANLAVAAQKDDRDDAAPAVAKPVFALPAPGGDFDALFRAAALNASRAQAQVHAMVAVAPKKDEALEALKARIAGVQTKLAQRQAEWDQLKTRIAGLTVEMTGPSAKETELAELIGKLSAMKFPVKKAGTEETEQVGLAPEKFISSVESFVATSQSSFKDSIVDVSDAVSRTRFNISGLNEVLAELLADLKDYQAKK